MSAIPVSTEFSVLSNSLSLLSFLSHFPQCLFYSLQTSYPLLLAGDIMPTSQKYHYHHHLPPYLNLQPFFCLIYPYICIYTFLSHWEIFNSGLILILIPLPMLRPMASHAQRPPSVKIVPSHMIDLSLSCEVTLSRLLCSCFACFVPYHHGTSLYTRLPEPDSWTF